MSKEAEEYFINWMEKEDYEYDNFPISELLEAYKNHCVNAISDEMKKRYFKGAHYLIDDFKNKLLKK